MNINDKKKGLIIIAISLIVVILTCVYTFVFRGESELKDDRNISITTKNKEEVNQVKSTEEEKEDEITKDEVDDTGHKDIKDDVAREKMSLEIIYFDELKEHISDENHFKKEIEDYLIKYDYWNEVKKLELIKLITFDYRFNKMVLEADLKDADGRKFADMNIMIDLNNKNMIEISVK